MAQVCDPDSYTLLDVSTTNGTLKFISPTTKAQYPARAEDTLLFQTVGGANANNRYEIALHYTPYTPVNPRIIIAEGCPNCKSKLVSFQRIGEQKKMIYVCLCGHKWE
jgi:DNA-directed RNA polymerase subunit M/transcription elongation factor TFIIS